MNQANDLAKHRAGADGEAREVWLPLDFGVRCTNTILRIWRARAWGIVEAAPQSGKSFAAMHVRDENCPLKMKDGTTLVKVIIGQSRGRERPRYLAKTLAASLGLPNRADLADLARGMARAMTTLVIVTDGHNLTWAEWGDLLTLHNTCKELYGVEFALVVLCVKSPNLFASSPTDPLARQIRDRLTGGGGLIHLPGHTSEKIGEALRLICDTYAPNLARDVSSNWPQVLKAFAARDLAPSGEIASRSLVQFVRWAASIRDRRPEISVRDLVSEAVEKMYVERMSLTGKAQVVVKTAAARPDEDAA